MSTITTTSSAQLPEWYNQYAQNLLARGSAVTSEPFQAYGAPRVAGFGQDQQQAFNMTRQNVGSWQPYMQQGAQQIAGAGAGSAAGMAQPYIQRGVGSFADNAQSYMNPYTQNVVNNVGTLAARNLSENLLPQVNRTFVGGGSFGGSRSAEFTNRAVRDANESALREQGTLLNQGYGQAADIYNQDAARNLQGGQAIGQFGAQDFQRQLQAGQATANIGQSIQQAQAVDTGAMAGIGQQQQALGQQSANLAYQDFERQRDYPWMQTERLSGLGRGLSLPESRQNTTPAPNQTGANIGNILAGIGAIVSGVGFGG